MKNLDNTELFEIREKISDTDKKMAELFLFRMNQVKKIAKYKKENGLDILDTNRENEIILKSMEYVKNEDEFVKESYIKFLEFCMELSKDYQNLIINSKTCEVEQ